MKTKFRFHKENIFLESVNLVIFTLEQIPNILAEHKLPSLEMEEIAENSD